MQITALHITPKFQLSPDGYRDNNYQLTITPPPPESALNRGFRAFLSIFLSVVFALFLLAAVQPNTAAALPYTEAVNPNTAIPQPSTAILQPYTEGYQPKGGNPKSIHGYPFTQHGSCLANNGSQFAADGYLFTQHGSRSAIGGSFMRGLICVVSGIIWRVNGKSEGVFLPHRHNRHIVSMCNTYVTMCLCGSILKPQSITN